MVDQERVGTNARSTVRTDTDSNALLRVLFSRIGEPHIGSPEAFAFNVPSGRATGLHLAELDHLLGLLDRLVDSGRSVIVIERRQAVMAHADWMIDLGPGAGHDGGRVVFEGIPADLVASLSTVIGRHLAEYLARQ